MDNPPLPFIIVPRWSRAIFKYLQPNACDIIAILMTVARNKHHFVQTTNIKMSQPAAAADVGPQRAVMENLDITREAHH